jgi:hypothetical protein
MVIFLLASILILQYTRIFNPKTYLEQFKDARDVLPSFENMEFDMGFFIDNFVALFWKQLPDPDNPGKTKGQLQYGFIFMILLFGLLMFMLKTFKITGNSGKFFLTSIYFYIFLLSIYLMHLIGHYNNVKERMKQARPGGNQQPRGGNGGGGPVTVN